MKAKRSTWAESKKLSASKLAHPLPIYGVVARIDQLLGQLGGAAMRRAETKDERDGVLSVHGGGHRSNVVVDHPARRLEVDQLTGVGGGDRDATCPTRRPALGETHWIVRLVGA
jgi:hypothetical protein